MRTLSRSLGVVAVALSLAAAASLAALAFGALSNLWADHQDSPTATYLLTGVPAAVGSLPLVRLAIRLLLRPRSH